MAATAGQHLADVLGPSENSLFNIAISNRSNRSLRDGSFSYNIPGSKLPGYYHSVPTGQRPPDTWDEIGLASRVFEDDDD